MTPKLVRKNYRGEMIPAAYGVYIVLFSLVGIAASWKAGFVEPRFAAIYAGAIASLGILGLVDDVFGNRDVGGFKGHFKKLIFERKLTTGAVKALGGGVAAMVIGASISRANVLQWMLATGLVALSANALNLLDLRPGRASAAFFAGMLAALAAVKFSPHAPWAVAAVAVPAFAGYCWDRQARAMMGDVGSNALGAALGVTIALSAPIWAQATFLVILFGLNVYSEKRSITAAIERNPILNKIDKLTGVR